MDKLWILWNSVNKLFLYLLFCVSESKVDQGSGDEGPGLDIGSGSSVQGPGKVRGLTSYLLANNIVVLCVVIEQSRVF